MFPDYKIFCEEVEATAMQQIYGFLQHPSFQDQKIRIMPDVHAGTGAVIGFTSTLSRKIIPNVIGVDIGCGVNSYNLGELEIDFQSLDTYIREEIPSGFNKRKTLIQRHHILKADMKIRHTFDELLDLIVSTSDVTNQLVDEVLRSLGTLGGGNHFLEVGKGTTGDTYLTIHTGSRGFGLKVANYHQKIAKTKNNRGDLSFLEDGDAKSYCTHMDTARLYAGLNRELIARKIISEFFKLNQIKQRIESVHNYIDFERGIIRKGAISAEKDEMVVIPWNMRDGLIIGKGKGNEDWNYSAPHGAGRIMARRVAKENLDIEEFKSTMAGVWTSCVNQGTLDESPMAYKDYKIVEASLSETVDVIDRVKPLYNFKASE